VTTRTAKAGTVHVGRRRRRWGEAKDTGCGERGAGSRDRTLSCSCPAAKSKNFVSRARTTPLRSVVLPASGSSKVAGQFRVGAGGAPTSDVGRSHNGPSPAAAEPDAFSELDRGPLGGGAAPITASGATAGILSGPHAHPPELPVSGFGNRNAGVGFYDARLVSFLIPLDVS
jgi:hypothetical protein